MARFFTDHVVKRAYLLVFLSGDLPVRVSDAQKSHVECLVIYHVLDPLPRLGEICRLVNMRLLPLRSLVKRGFRSGTMWNIADQV